MQSKFHMISVYMQLFWKAPESTAPQSKLHHKYQEPHQTGQGQSSGEVQIRIGWHHNKPAKRWPPTKVFGVFVHWTTLSHTLHRAGLFGQEAKRSVFSLIWLEYPLPYVWGVSHRPFGKLQMYFIWSVIAKGLNTYACTTFQFVIIFLIFKAFFIFISFHKCWLFCLGPLQPNPSKNQYKLHVIRQKRTNTKGVNTYARHCRPTMTLVIRKEHFSQ